MLEQHLKKLLYSFLQNIIEDFSENDIELSKWKGTLELKNLNIKQEYLTDIGVRIGFPLVKESAVIEKLQLSIPWTKIRSEPIVVKIKGLKVICRTNGKYNQEFSEKRLIEKKYQLLQKLLKQIELDILTRKSEKFNIKENNQNLYDQDDDDDDDDDKDTKKEGQSQQMGENEGNFIKKKMNIYKNYLGQIKEIILQNIRIEVEDVVLKLQDEGIATQNNFIQLAIAFQKLLISPANSDFEPTFINPEQIKKEQKKYQIYKLTKFEIFANQDSYLDYQNLDFDKQYILHPVDIDIQKTKNNNKEELQTLPSKTTKICISQVRVELFEKQFKHIRNLLKYKNWNCEMGVSLHLRPNYNENVLGNAKSWLTYLLDSLKLRILLQQFSIVQIRKNLKEIKEYIFVYKQKLEFELEQKMAAYKFANSNLNFNELQKQQKDLTVEHRKIDINDIEKELEEREKDLFKQPIQPVDIIFYRDIAKIQFRKEQNNQFQKLLKLKKENQNKQLEKQKAKNIFQKALQKEKIKNVFSWLTSKIRRKSSISSNGNILSEDQILQNEEEEKEQLLQDEFNQLIESYTEGQALTIIQEQMKGQIYIKNKISVEFKEDIQISLMSVNTGSNNNQNTKINNIEKVTENLANKSQQQGNNNSRQFQRNESNEYNYELLHIKIKIQQCMKISTNINTMIKFAISEFDCRHSINSNDNYKKALSNLDREKNIQKPSLSLKIISQKNRQTNQVSYRFSLNIASHRFILTDVFFSSIASFFSMKQQSRSFLEDFNLKTKQVKQKIDLYLAQQIRKIFGHKITFDKVDVKCGKLLFIFPEKFSDTQKPLIEFVIKSLFLSNKPIDKSNLKKIIQDDRKKYKYCNNLQNIDFSIQQNINNNINIDNTIYKSFLKESDLMYSIQNGQQSYFTNKTDQFQSVLEFNPAFNQSKDDAFDDLKSLVQEGHSDDEDSDNDSCKNKVYINHQVQGLINNIENKESEKLQNKEEQEQKIIKKLLENNYFQSLKNSSLNESKIDNLQINFMISKISTHFCQNGMKTNKNEKYKILEDFQIETCLKRYFEHQQFEDQINIDLPLPVKSKSQENKLNELPLNSVAKESKQEKEIKTEKNKLPKKRQTVSLDDFQGQMITEYFEKDKYISKVQLAVEMKINLIGINIYLDTNEQIIKIISQYNKIFTKKENIPNELSNFVYQQKQHFNQDNIFRANQTIDEENLNDNKSNLSEQNFKSVLGSPLDLQQNQENQQQVQNNRLNTTYQTIRDEEFFDAVEDFSQFFKQHSQIFQHPPLNNLEKPFLNGNYLYECQNQALLNGDHIKYSNEEMKKRMEIIRQARNQSYIVQLHSQYLRQKMIKKSSSRLFQSEQIYEGYYDEEINKNKMSNDQQQIKEIRQNQQSIDEDMEIEQFEKQLSLRDLITLDFTFNLDEFRIYVMSSKKKHKKHKYQGQQQTLEIGDIQVKLPEKTSALIITKTRINITFMPSFSGINQDLNDKSDFSNSLITLEEQQKTENKSIQLDSQQNIQQQILLAQNKNNLVKSENCLENLSRKKSLDFIFNFKQNTNHVVKTKVEIDQVYITIYKIDKILQLFNHENDNQALKKANNLEKTDKQQLESIDCGKSAEQKDQKILNNLKTILLIKDSEININFKLNKGCLKFQDSRKQIKVFKEFVELSVDDVELKTDEYVPIKFDFSELRYIEQLEKIMNYVQYNIQLGWRFNASYTNMYNKQTEPFVEDMKINLELIQQNYKKEIIYECQNDILVNFHPALIDNIFLLQQTFLKVNKHKNKEKGNNQKKAENQQNYYQYEISNQTGITFKIEFPRGTKLKSRLLSSQSKNYNEYYPVQIEVKSDVEYLIEFVKDGKSNSQKVKYSSHDIKVIINNQTTVIDLLQSSRDTYIKLNGDSSIVCQPITYNDRKIVFRSNIKLTNLTHFNFDFYFSHQEQQVLQKQMINQQNKKSIDQQNQHINNKQNKIQVKKLSEQYIPLQLFQMKYLQVQDQDKDSKNNQTHTYFFKDNIFNYIPIMVSMVMPSEPTSSIQSLNEEFQQNEALQQSYLIIRRLRNESSNIQTQTTVANGFQNVQLLSSETREIQIVIQYPILLHNLNPLPLDISFLYPNEYENYKSNKDPQIPFYELLMKIVKDHKQLQQNQDESDHEEDHDEDAFWKKLNYNKYKMSLGSGQSTYLSSFNIFLMCKVSVELQYYHQFKPLEIFDYKTIKTYWDFLMSFQIFMEQQYNINYEGNIGDSNQAGNSNSNNSANFSILEQSELDQEQQLIFLKSSTGSQFITSQQQNENSSQYTPKQLQNNPFVEPIIKQKTLQLLNKEGKQMNLVFDIKYSYEGMLEITLKSQYWFLNETEFALNLQIKENRYLYPQMFLPGKKVEKTTQFKVPNSYNQNINFIQGSQSAQQTTNSFSSSQQLFQSTKERKDQVGGVQQDGLSFQNSYKKSPCQNNNFLSAEKLNDKKDYMQGHEHINIRQFDDGMSQLDQEKQQNLNNQNEETDMKSSYFGINSNNFSIAQIEQLFKAQSQNIQIFTGNFSSEKQFMFEIPQDEIESLLQIQQYKDKNNEETTSHDHHFTTDFMQLEQKNENLSFKQLKYLSVMVNQVSLPERYQGIKFYIITPIIIIRNSSNHFLSVNQFISSQQSVESSLSPHQTRQLKYDQVHYPYIQLKPAHNFSLWSQKFPVNKPSQFIIKINHINKSNSFILLRITISKESSLHLITIEDTNEYPPFKIVNLTNEELAVSQKNFQSQSLFVKMQQNPKEIQNNVNYDEKLIDHFLKDFSPFGWDDPFGEETIMISTMDSLLCNLTKKDFQEKNYTKVVRLIEDDIVIKVFQDKQYPKTKIIMILYEKNQKLFDEYKFEENIYQNLTFRLNINKIGISIVDSHPREIIYFQMEQVQINFKQLNKRFEILVEIQDIQGDYQAAKPLPAPFLVTKKTQHKDRSAKLKKIMNTKNEEIKQNKIDDQQQKEDSFFQKIYSHISSLWRKPKKSTYQSQNSDTNNKDHKPTQNLETLKIEQHSKEIQADDRSISSQIEGKMPKTPSQELMTPIRDSKNEPIQIIDTKLHLDLQQLRYQQQQKEIMEEDRTVTSQMTGTVTPATLTQRSQAISQYKNTAILKYQQANKNSTYKSFFKLNYIQQYYESTKINHIEKFKIQVQPIETNIDGDLIHRLIQFYKEIQTLLQKHPKEKQSQQNLSEEQVPQIFKKVFLALPLQKKQIQKPKKQEKIFQFMIEKVDILPISVDLKFSNLHTSKLNLDSSNINYFIMILLNLIGSNKFYFDRYNDENHLYTIQNLTKNIFNHYYSSIENQIFNIIVNANLIGNPGQLFKEIGFAFVDLINNIFEEVHRSEEANITEKFYQSAFKSGYTFTKKVAQAFKSSAQVISKSIISELFDHVDQNQISKNILMQIQQNKHKGQDKTQTKEEYFSDINQLKNFKGNFVNLFHTAFLFPLSTPYSLNSVMVKKLQKLDQKKIKSLQSILKVKRYPRAVKKIENTYCLEKYEPKRSLGKLFFEAFNLMEFGDFEDTITEQYELMHNKIWYITKERFIIIDEEQLRIIFNIAKQDVSYVGINDRYLKFKYCVDTQEGQKHQTISMKVLNLHAESYEIKFDEQQIKHINESYNSAFEYKNYFNPYKN
ncbi:hypothetical protein ABPG72_018002 [Tetrahymena utriculariae]